eukprot:TRINITY_DN1815_c0_g2_i1.p1 TRINITY_DN1815_c0_g2~~TRINITY_DN1815_c0_g2_i1.p1  ORF type:complete len:376 (-),score=91.29 TRINITY_DN1815_c0_g2_i1:111-1238(-)
MYSVSEDMSQDEFDIIMERTRQEFQQIEEENKKLEKEMEQLRKMEAEIEKENNTYWEEYNRILKVREQQEYDRDIGEDITAQIASLKEEINRLKNINVYTDTFVISRTTHGIATINNLRLGRLSPQISGDMSTLVSWKEINSAWGEVTIALYTIAKKLGFNFSRYKLIPSGSKPSIQLKLVPLSSRQAPRYPLYGTDEITFGSRTSYFNLNPLWGSQQSNEFDTGMEAFLQCVSEICAHVMSSVNLPYYITKDKIGSSPETLKSIKITNNTEADWTKALLYMLTNIRRILDVMPKLGSRLDRLGFDRYHHSHPHHHPHHHPLNHSTSEANLSATICPSALSSAEEMRDPLPVISLHSSLSLLGKKNQGGTAFHEL